MSHPKNNILEQNRAVWKLFNIMFSCTVRSVDNYSIDHLAMRGMIDSGSALKNKQTANALVYREMTINTMVELYKTGATVNIVNPADTKKIYEIVAEHLEDWKEYLRTQMNTGDAPIEDLILLDKFASIVYKHALPHFTREIAKTFIDGSAVAMMKADIMNAFGQASPGVVKEEETKMPDQRDSLAGAFKTYVRGNNGERKWS